MDDIGAYLEGRAYQPTLYVPKSWQPIMFKNYCDYTFDLYDNGMLKYRIEQHWALSVRRYQMELALSALDSHIVSGELNNQPIEKLNAVGTYIFTCVHHVTKEDFFCLKHVFDLVAISRNLKEDADWEKIILFGEKYDILMVFLVGVGIAKMHCPLDLPDFIEMKLKSKKIQKLINKKIVSLNHSLKEEDKKVVSFWDNLLYQMTLRKKLSTKVKILYYHILLILQPTKMDLNVKEKFSFFNYVKLFISKPFRLIAKYVG